MSAKEVIAEIDALPATERQAIYAHVHQLEETEVPENFRRSMAEALAGRGVDIMIMAKQLCHRG